MKKLSQIFALSVLAVIAVATMANAAGTTRYKDRMFEVTKTSDVVFASNVPQLKTKHSLSKTIKSFTNQDIYLYANETDTEPVDLKMDIYSPKGDKATKRAAVIVAHGGAMISGSKESKQKSVYYCDSLAARGFVAVSVGFREGMSVSGDFSLNGLLKGNTYKLTVDSADFARAVYRGVQDINAAVRYMRKKATKLGIDSNRIYILGNSSGAILAMENIYANNKADFPSYMEYDGVPDLGELNDFGQKGVSAHANGGVFLWGGIHNPGILRHNKTPVYLVHGEADETVPFKVGNPVQNFALPAALPKAYANRLSVKVDAPTLYGSFVVDSTLAYENGTKLKPETYFVEDAGHEFYDKEEYTDKVQSKVFNFLYKLASSDKIVYSFAAITITEDADGNLHAIVDGEYKGTDTVNVDKGIEVKDVVFDRTFGLAGHSTVLLPFSVDSASVKGAKQFLKFTGVIPNKVTGVKEVHTKRAWCDLDALLDDINLMDLETEEKDEMKAKVTKKCQSIPNQLVAYTPYIVQMKETQLSFTGPVTIEPTKNPADTVVDDWIFRGTLAIKLWLEDHPELGAAFGYTTSGNETISPGEFVMIGKNSSIAVLRSYLLCSSKVSSPSGASAAPAEKLPTHMNVVIDDDDEDEENTTVIGQIDTRTGEFRFLPTARRYDIKGRKVVKSRNVRGSYYGKRVYAK